MIFLEYLRIFGTENTARGASTWPRGWRARPTPWARPLPRGPMVAILHLFLHPHTPSSSHKHQYPAQARVLAHFAAIFDLLAQSTSHNTAWGDCSCWKYALEAIINGYYSIPLFMVIVYCSCYNCIVRKS